MMETFDRENQDAFGRLRDLLQEQASSFIALLGAGASSSTPDSYPLWSELINLIQRETAAQLNQDAPRFYDRIKDAPVQAQLYRGHLSNKAYFDFLCRTFAPRDGKVSELARRIANLSVAHFVTTNYENLIERSCAEVERELRCVDWHDAEAMQAFFQEMNDPRAVTRCIFLHGRITKPESIIFTEQDYVNQYVRSEESKRKLFVLFATKRVLFVGFSLSDPDLMFLQREAWATIPAAEPRHFAILGWGERNWVDDDPSARRMLFRTKFGIDPIFYPVRDNGSDHSALVQILGLLPERSGGGGASTAERQPDVELPSIAQTQLLKPEDPDDPERGRWGGKSEQNGRKLWCEKIDEFEGYPGWFSIRLRVDSTNRDKPLTGAVRFHLHPTFYPSIREVAVVNGRASLDLEAYGAFSVGAEADNGRTTLELNLAGDEVDAPPLFKSR